MNTRHIRRQVQFIRWLRLKAKICYRIATTAITQHNPITFEEWDEHFKKLLHKNNSNLNLETTAAPRQRISSRNN